MVEIRTIASSSSGNCHRVSDGSTPLLLDCGLPWKRIRRELAFQTSGISGVLLSHAHMDHAKGIGDAMKAGMDCYMLKETAEALGLKGHRVKIVKPLEQFRLGTWTILPFDIVHDVPGVGFLLASPGGKVLFMTDSAYCKYRFKGLTHLLIECNHSLPLLRAGVGAGDFPVEHKRRLMQTHMSLEQVIKFLQANDLSAVQEIRLIHLSDRNSDAAAFADQIKRATGKPTYVA